MCHAGILPTWFHFTSMDDPSTVQVRNCDKCQLSRPCSSARTCGYSRHAPPRRVIHQNCFASIPQNSPQCEPAAIDESLGRPLRQPRRFDGSIAGHRHANVCQGPREQHQTRGDVHRNMGSQRPRRTLREGSADRASAHACPAHWTQAWPNTRRGLMPCAGLMACAMTSAGDFLREACKLAETDSSGRAGDFVQASWHVQRPRLCSPQ